jgi:hypothetical protein
MFDDLLQWNGWLQRPDDYLRFFRWSRRLVRLRRFDLGNSSADAA